MLLILRCAPADAKVKVSQVCMCAAARRVWSVGLLGFEQHACLWKALGLVTLDDVYTAFQQYSIA